MDEGDPIYWRYVRGCQRLELTPLDELEFWEQYDRYYRCDRVIQQYERRCHDPEFWRSLGSPEERRRLAGMMFTITQERDRLGPLVAAVAAGQNNTEEDEGGTGIPAYALPDVPILSGSAAKLLPPLDPEPQWRDP